MPKKEEQSTNSSLGAASGLNGKTITAVNAWTVGSLRVVEIGYAAGSTLIKFNQGQCEWGGTGDWGTGKRVF